jgi:hypothetical protein
MPPPTSVPPSGDSLESLLSRLQEAADDSPSEEFREIVEQVIDAFRND